MKSAVLGSVCVVGWGFFAAACISGCATGGSGPGSDAPASSDDGGGDATATPGSDGGSSHDSGTAANADARTDATLGADSGGDAEVGSDTGGDVEGDAGAGADVGGADAPAGRDSGVDAEAGSMADATADAHDASEAGGPDASPIAGFGTTCPAGTVYSDTFATNPLTSGNWTTLIGPITYDSTNHLLQLAQGTPNTQAWIGARPAWTNYTVSAQVRLDSAIVDAGGTGNGGINFRIVDPGPTNPPNDSGKMYFAGINASQVLLGIENTGWTPLAILPASFTLGTFHTLTVSAKGTTLSVAVDGTTYATVVDTTFATGGIGLRTYLAAASYGAMTVTCNP
jgi:hypothetical protein